MKGKDMILSDFLSGQKNNDSNLLTCVKSWMIIIIMKIFNPNKVTN